MSTHTPSRKYPCPCCGLLTLDEPPPGTYDICPVCWWEDDNVQYADPTFEGGANRESLCEAQHNFRKFGAKNQGALQRVRKPAPDEFPR